MKLNFEGTAVEENQVSISLLGIKTQTANYNLHTDYRLRQLSNIRKNIILEEGKIVNIHFNDDAFFMPYIYNLDEKELQSLNTYKGQALVGFLSYDSYNKKVIVYDNGYKDVFGNSVDANKIGTTSQRPQNVKFGFIYKNTETGKWEIFNGTNWENIDGTQAASADIAEAASKTNEEGT